MFHLTTKEIEEKNAVHTAGEIHHQPAVWQELVTTLFSQKEVLNEFVESIYAKHDQVRVILTGAGTSAFIGDTLAPELNRQNSDKVQFEAIATTDIVSNPTEYLFADVPTIMVSFARSGNSPESLATVALGQKLIKDFYQVVITCNKEGQLAQNIQHDDQSITVLMPEKSNDKSLAMTSSFTCMMIAAHQIFSTKPFTGDGTKQVIDNAERLVETVADQVDDILTFDFDRIVYLGSGSLSQLAHEASLKMLELTAGKVVALNESSLGFRHGPKSILNEKSAVVIFMSENPYTRKYDLDILRELTAGDSGMKVIALTEKKDEAVEELADWTIPVNYSEERLQSDFSLALLYIIFAQVLAMKKSLQLGITPDNPSPTGAISRVVQGVTIHEYEG
ncbi:tagatose-6-phosphate ketose/aldose isomerase [Virgibacillus halotolerans]|uniref:SIS domain-containing protein n=1 Tax=Virgibacillus halotolerans TaxID=1071053 RepID=UPI0019608352|nr:SIS domain-containing protein [Virgibacillus halotolerans]MBM7600016.1 tagatose-6-phosphate ketose/aldose isomerase [Virgibacillus halotolerans]